MKEIVDQVPENCVFSFPTFFPQPPDLELLANVLPESADIPAGKALMTALQYIPEGMQWFSKCMTGGFLPE